MERPAIVIDLERMSVGNLRLPEVNKASLVLVCSAAGNTVGTQPRTDRVKVVVHSMYVRGRLSSHTGGFSGNTPPGWCGDHSGTRETEMARGPPKDSRASSRDWSNGDRCAVDSVTGQY